MATIDQDLNKRVYSLVFAALSKETQLIQWVRNCNNQTDKTDLIKEFTVELFKDDNYFQKVLHHMLIESFPMKRIVDDISNLAEDLALLESSKDSEEDE